jgi:hypothetical protein
MRQDDSYIQFLVKDNSKQISAFHKKSANWSKDEGG